MVTISTTKTGLALSEFERKRAFASAAKTRHPSDETEDARSTPEIAREREAMASAGIRHLSDIIEQLVELRKAPETDEYGVLRATEHAYEVACQLMTDAAIVSTVSALGSRAIPRGCASTDSEGGVRIDWMRTNAAVCLVVPASKDREPFVYHEAGGTRATEHATDESLARWLRDIS